MTEPVADSLIPYDEIVQEALRAVVRRVLLIIEASGLPGAHHFYVAFRTRFPGVEMPKHLADRYPEEMTIVIQHRYWDLAIDDEAFEIGLSFNQVPAKLRIPFDAVTGFVDPAVNFALQFQAQLPEGAPPAPAPTSPEVEAATSDPSSNVVSLFPKK